MDISDPYFQNQIAAQLRPSVTRGVAGSVAVPGDEDELQEQAEKYLVRMGYVRLTSSCSDRVSKGVCPVGFFGHWNENEKNPLMPDLMIVDYPLRRKPLFVELKRKNKWQPGQKKMIEIGLWKLCWTIDEFAGVLAEWVNKQEEMK